MRRRGRLTGELIPLAQAPCRDSRGAAAGTVIHSAVVENSETSMAAPSPVRAWQTSAWLMARAAASPVAMSATDTPTRPSGPGAPDNRHQTALGLHQQVVGLHLGIRPSRSVSRDVAGHQPGVLFPQGLRVEPQRLGHAHGQVLDETSALSIIRPSSAWSSLSLR